MIWTDVRVSVLRDLWRKGISASIIARDLGVTRNAILGKVHRLQLAGRQTALRKPITKTNVDRNRLAGARLRARTRAKAAITRLDIVVKLKAQPGPQAEVTERTLVRFVDRERHQCAYIPGEPSHDAMCCGYPVVPGLPYCPTHARRCYVAPTPRTQKHTPVEPALEPARRVRVFA